MATPEGNKPNRGRLWKRFFTLARPIFQSRARPQAVGLLAILIVLLFTVSGLNVVNSFVGRDFMTALSERHIDRFYPLAFAYLGVFAASTLIAAFQRFTEERLGLFWRQWLTGRVLERYLSGRAYYRIKEHSEVDNPDQRIAEDIKTFTTMTLSLFLIFLNATVTVCAFSGVLWSISPWLFVVAVIYATGGSCLTLLVGRQLVGLDVQQLQTEADLRFELARTREHAETIALLQAERDEGSRIIVRLQAVVANMRRIIYVNRRLSFSTTGYNYLIQLIPVLIVAPLYFRGEIELGKVTQSSMAFAHLLGAFSLIVVEFQRLSSFAAVVARVGALWEATETRAELGEADIEIVESPGRLAYDRLTLLDPEGRPLLRSFSLDLRPGKRLLIVGPNGAGKTALLRATAGLFAQGSGMIHRPPLDTIRFLPQHPYTGFGTLREALLFGVPREKLTDERLVEVVRQVGLEPVLDRAGGLHAERDWSTVLSVGEKQCLAFARLLLAHPAFAILDEPVSALDVTRTRALYEGLVRGGVTYVTLDSAAGLLRYHDLVLEFLPDGSWQTPAPRDADKTGLF